MGGHSQLPKDPLLLTHYEVLGLPQNCTFKEIREAFVKLSKKVHPDVNPGDPHGHQSFLKLNEAYSVLIKPHKRQIYDASLISQRYSASSYPTSYHSYVNGSWVETSAPFGRTSHPEWRDETIWEFRDKSKDKHYQDKPYYGIKGVNRFPNSYIAAGCVLFTVVGAIFHYFVIKKSSAKALKEIDTKSKENNDLYMKIRKQALASSTESTISRLTKEWENGDKRRKQ